ncbi:esterase/lipase, putative (plasmid) [Acaryochloris marina MBIC11017]|uniref:Esterase/lipase, putative n=2 Tax=Acaryochloris marina TaxID=155978 RepID=A8ZPC6_ACAM1|nr:esterase/lipase, putative [Acaryochloris marina MBIC11017]
MHQPSYFSGFDLLSSDIEKLLMPDAKPQFCKAKPNGDAVVICVHGFTGNPYDVSPAISTLSNMGLSVVAPLLPGHGYRERHKQEQAFSNITPEGMLSAARQEIARAREHYSKVGMFGFSMGGAISLTMASEGLIDACAVAAPALRLSRKAEILIPLLSWASFSIEAPPQEPFYLPVYEFYHSKALRTLWQLSGYARRRLSHIQCPVFAVHSHKDLMVPPIVLGMMQENIPFEIETAWFDESGHSMLLDVSGPRVSSAIASFFQRQFLH